MAAQEPSGEVDFGYLESFLGGDPQIVAEVLGLFLQQAQGWAGALDADNPAWRDVVHTIKGSARGVGANRLGDLCVQAEAGDGEALPAVREALAAAVTEMTAHLAKG